MNIFDINIFSIIYLAFRMGPFIMVSYFLIYSLFNNEYTSMIYLGGVILVCFITMLTGNSIPTSSLNWGPKEPNTFCNVLHTNTGEALSKLPLSVAIYVYSLCYFAVPIYKKKTQKNNIIFFAMFSLLIIYDILWLYVFRCGTFFTIVLSGLIGTGVGIGWGEIVYRTRLQSSQGLNDVKCTLPEGNVADKKKYNCMLRTKNQEGFENNQALTKPFVTCSSPPLNVSPSSNSQNAIYKFIDNQLRSYPTSAIVASWNNGDSNPPVEEVNCSKIPTGDNMDYNLSYYGIVENSSYYSVSTLTTGFSEIAKTVFSLQNQVLKPASSETQPHLTIFYNLCSDLTEAVQANLIQLKSLKDKDKITDKKNLILYYSIIQVLITEVNTTVAKTPKKLAIVDPKTDQEIKTALDSIVKQLTDLLKIPNTLSPAPSTTNFVTSISGM